MEETFVDDLQEIMRKFWAVVEPVQFLHPLDHRRFQLRAHILSIAALLEELVFGQPRVVHRGAWSEGNPSFVPKTSVDKQTVNSFPAAEIPRKKVEQQTT